MTASTIDKETLRAFQRVLRQSSRPLDADDPYYVPLLHGSDAEDVIERLFQTIQDTEGSGLYYFTGQRGTGKSTELRRLKTLLNGNGYRCILFDALNYVHEAKPIDAEMLMLAVAAGLADEMERTYKQDVSIETPVSRFWAWLQTDVTLESITVPGSGMKFNLRAQQDTLAQRIADMGSPQRFHQTLLDHIAEMAEFVRQREQRPVVLVVDSLENLRGNPMTADDKQLFASVAKVFADQMDMLKVLGVHMVYSVPPYLCLLENVRAYVPWFSLASVRVCEDPKKARRTPRGTGLAVMRSVLDKRWFAWRDVLAEQAADKLALLCGGDLRQFILRLLVDVLHEAQFALDRLPLTASDPILQDMEQACATEMLQLTVRDEWPLLSQITRDNTPVMPRRDQLQTLAHLLDTKVILNYRNGRDWYDIHPSLWKAMDDFASTSTGAAQ